MINGLNKILTVLFGISLPFVLHSALIANETSAPNIKGKTFFDLKPVFTFTPGASIFQKGPSQTLSPIDVCSLSKSATDSFALWEGFIGSEIKRASSWGILAGLGYYQPNYFNQNSKHKSFNNYSQQLLAEGKLFLEGQTVVQPFFTLGLGATFNNQTNLFDLSSNVSSYKPSNLSYAMGSGVDLILSKIFKIGVGYRFSDLGKDTASAQYNLDKSTHIYANQLLAQLTFIPQSY